MRFDVGTKASPEQVRGAFTDFTDRRPRIWNRTLDPAKYEVRELGDTWAVARESSPGSPFWVVARYDWSDPDVIRWTVVESSYGGDGGGSVRITPADGGGSRLDVEWNNTNARSQKLLLSLLHRGPMRRLLARMWATTLDRYAARG
ncbi:SRPBCC family protein [Actinoplanes sp. NPDC051861]|uniref:SRPBCC family protein n=1 Tax=Actinoplanes sp. NPDC051861 TaxID=3155170 RepID=UPI0034410E4E